MHMRKKKWARPELDACPWYTGDPAAEAGHWRQRFERPEQPLQVELGCGKGVSTAQMVADHPEINFVAIDLSPDVLGDARRNIVSACDPRPVENACLVWANIEQVSGFFTPEDGVERIYISFCNPWPRRRHEKRRLTHPRQLAQYRQFLRDGGEIWFKTDDDGLFEDSLTYFRLCGFEAVKISRDLHGEGFQPNYVSEHEAYFTGQGIPIKLGIFRKTDTPLDFDPLRWHLERDDEEEAATDA